MPSRGGLLPVLIVLAACANPESDRLKATSTGIYDPVTGRLTEITYDANQNGIIDTWTVMDGARAVSTRQDRNEDGKLDRWEYYGPRGELLKVGFSRKDDGRVDAWAYAAPGGAVERIEVSSSGDEAKIDRWERYGAGRLVAVEADTDGDGVPDTWETYVDGALTTAAFDENHDGRPDRQLTYEAGTLATIATVPDAAGRFTRQVHVRRSGDPRHRP